MPYIYIKLIDKSSIKITLKEENEGERGSNLDFLGISWWDWDVLFSKMPLFTPLFPATPVSKDGT